MGKIEVTPDQLQGLGGRIAVFGRQMRSVSVDAAFGSGVTEPPRTAAALDSLNSSWTAGLDRLADDVEILGLLTQVVSHEYTETDNDAIPGGRIR